MKKSKLLPCGCSLNERTWLDVGRGVYVRQRVQIHIYGRRGVPPEPILEEFQEEPHGHIVFFAVWYLPKNMLSIVEDVLIEHCRPKRNVRNTSGGFSRPDLWVPTLPDVIGDINHVIVSRSHRGHLYVQKSPLKHKPGVYAFFVDPVGEYMSFTKTFKDLPLFQGGGSLPPDFKEAIKRREKTINQSKKRKKIKIVCELEEEAEPPS